MFETVDRLLNNLHPWCKLWKCVFGTVCSKVLLALLKDINNTWMLPLKNIRGSVFKTGIISKEENQCFKKSKEAQSGLPWSWLIPDCCIKLISCQRDVDKLSTTHKLYSLYMMIHTRRPRNMLNFEIHGGVAGEREPWWSKMSLQTHFDDESREGLPIKAAAK